MCSHLEKFGTTNAWTKFWKDECVLCFDDVKSPNGINVCLQCFRGHCLGPLNHSYDHFQRSGHPLVLNIQKIFEADEVSEDAAPAQEITKVAIGVEGGASLEGEGHGKWVDRYSLRCLACNKEDIEEASFPEALKGVVDAVKDSNSATTASTLQSWEVVIKECEHTLNLEQDASAPKLAAKKLAHCGECDLNNNLWLCMTCGHLGCGRSYADGSGGNAHGVAHHKETGHPVVVKMGTVTAEGTADIFCYACDDAAKDPKLAEHFAHLGIDVTQQEKTEKSTGELELEQNLKLDFTSKADEALAEAKFGPGYTGMQNIGNSCYLASVVQNMFNLREFQERYVPHAADHHAMCGNDPSECWQCQAGKLADGLFSGRYSQRQERHSIDHTTKEEVVSEFQNGIAPRMFKALVAGTHQDFGGMQQQDAFEYFQYLLGKIQQFEKTSSTTTALDPTSALRFSLEQRLQCTQCQRVRYTTTEEAGLLLMLAMDAANPPLAAAPAEEKPEERKLREQASVIPLDQCVAKAFAAAPIEGFQCPQCAAPTLAMKKIGLASTPPVLVTTMSRQDQSNWVPRKLHVSVALPPSQQQSQGGDKEEKEGEAKEHIVTLGTPGLLSLEAFVVPSEKNPDELLLPEDPVANAGPSIDPTALQQLLMMDIPENRAKRAIVGSGNCGAEAAMEWLFAHMDDADIDDPLPAASSASEVAVNPEQLDTLMAICACSPAHAKKALGETNGDLERAVDWVFSHPDDGTDGNQEAAPLPVDSRPPLYELVGIVEHRGTSPHSGHYVAYLRKHGDVWVQFNDSRVHVSKAPPFSQAYMYFWRKIDATNITASSSS